MKLTGQGFSSNHVTTIGIDFFKFQIQHQGQKVPVMIWDTAGQERFRAITSAYYRGAHAIAIVYDITA